MSVSSLSARLPMSLLALLVVASVCASEDAWPGDVMGFWRVSRGTLQREGHADVLTDGELLIFVESKIILISGDETGFPSAVMYETSGRRATDEFPRHVLVPNLEVAKDGQESRSDIEYPLELKLVQRKSPAKIELVMRFEDEIVKFEGVQLKRSQGAQTLRRLLGSDFLCSPQLRQLLERVAIGE